VVRIVPCFDEETVTINHEKPRRATSSPSSASIRSAISPSTASFPAPDGSFYDIGFGSLLDDFTAAIDAIGNQMLDAGTLQNAQGGFIGNGVKIRSGDLRFRSVGEWKRVDVTGGTLAQNIVPLNLPGPSAVLYNLFVFLVGMAKEVTSASDALTGVSSGTEQPTTLLARIEQASKVMTAIFKRIHRSFGEELRMLFKLNADFLKGETPFALNDTPGKVSGDDYQKPEQGPDIDVVPVSDPTMVIDAMRAVRAQALGEFKGDPNVNQKELTRRILEGTGQPDIDALMKVDAPQPDPALLIEGARLALDKMKADAQFDKDKANAAQWFMTAANDAAAIGLMSDAAMFAGAATKLATESARYTLETPNGEPAGGPGAVGGMAPAPDDAGLPAIPPGPGDVPPDIMGGGGELPVDPAGPPGGGGDAQRIAEPVQ
jgi:chaperonin GroES